MAATQRLLGPGGAWASGGVRDVYKDYNELTLRITMAALFGADTEGPEAQVGCCMYQPCCCMYQFGIVVCMNIAVVCDVNVTTGHRRVKLSLSTRTVCTSRRMALCLFQSHCIA